MKLSADEVTVPIDWREYRSGNHSYCAGCGGQLAFPAPYPNETKPHTVLDCLKEFTKRIKEKEAPDG